LLEAGAAIRCNNLPAAAWKIARLLDDPAKLARMREAARDLGQPRAAEAVAEDAMRLLN
jgi:processive 1,2-diacylglycerol beta-glucosyltransferase